MPVNRWEVKGGLKVHLVIMSCVSTGYLGSVTNLKLPVKPNLEGANRRSTVKRSLWQLLTKEKVDGKSLVRVIGEIEACSC